MTKSLRELNELLAVQKIEGQPVPLVQLVKTVWTKALNGDRYCIQLLWEMFSAVEGDRAETLNSDLVDAIEKAYNDSDNLPPE